MRKPENQIWTATLPSHLLAGMQCPLLHPNNEGPVGKNCYLLLSLLSLQRTLFLVRLKVHKKELCIPLELTCKKNILKLTHGSG